MIVPQYRSSKITVFVWGKNTILQFLGNTEYKSMKLTLQLVVVVLIAPTKFHDNLFACTGTCSLLGRVAFVSSER